MYIQYTDINRCSSFNVYYCDTLTMKIVITKIVIIITTTIKLVAVGIIDEENGKKKINGQRIESFLYTPFCLLLFICVFWLLVSGISLLSGDIQGDFKSE